MCSRTLIVHEGGATDSAHNLLSKSIYSVLKHNAEGAKLSIPSQWEGEKGQLENPQFKSKQKGRKTEGKKKHGNQKNFTNQLYFFWY